MIFAAARCTAYKMPRPGVRSKHPCSSPKLASDGFELTIRRGYTQGRLCAGASKLLAASAICLCAACGVEDPTPAGQASEGEGSTGGGSGQTTGQLPETTGTTELTGSGTGSTSVGEDSSATSASDTAETDGDSSLVTVHTVEELYSLLTIPEFHITLDAAAQDALAVEPKQYVEGSFRYGEHSYAKVGVRFKGNLSLKTLDEKPSIKIKFNEYDGEARFLGLEKLTMHNMWVDQSMLREWLAYKLFRSIGVAAPRTGYLRLWINGIDYGLYLNVETPDKLWLAANFDDPRGNLYEGEHGDDLDKSVSGYEQDEGEDKSRADLKLLHDLATDHEDALFYGADTPLDVDEALAFLAGEAFVGHFDGYWTSHNYFLYHEVARDRWTYHPWSLDQTFSARLDAFDGGGYLKEKCLGLERCVIDYIHTGLGIADVAEGLDFGAEVDRVLALISDSALSDPRKPYDNEVMQARQRAVRSWAVARPAAFRERVDCLVDGKDPDVDGDGYGSCFADCDDADAAINPDAPEVCDEVDNDCSGFADDVPACECPSMAIQGATFYFCRHSFRWRDAARFCEDQGHTLAHFDSQAQNDAVAVHASGLSGGRWAMGLNDRASENVYVWPDGTSPSFTSWGEGEPAHLLDWFDCGFIRNRDGVGKWEERNCIQHAYFICR